ncbi:hypothetical protein B0A55_02296 [Friedmanniomyces simplex]|uniref:Uncharacterized protein n=1 Tax=Friedmanniomyces simplex TaxID=329884 RepID=A0A4U0Y1G8_9PEZI|nr:hypothetical protein B0A55_02296 [Friedmanniomyces simplex]
MGAPGMPAYGTPTPYNGNRAPSMPHQQMQMLQRPPPSPAMPPPNHVLPSQQHAVLMVGYPTPHQYPHPQLMTGPPQPPQPQYGTSYNNQHPQHIRYANGSPTHPGMAGGPQGIMPPAGLHGYGQGRGNRMKKSPTLIPS